jgi:hypothetical protein
MAARINGPFLIVVIFAPNSEKLLKLNHDLNENSNNNRK